ncbi:MAG: hypothetical protein ACXWID_14580 [Pyrinomonadaceae bacterium]
MKTTLGVLTEEGRTRLKNALRRTCGYALAMFVVGGFGGYAIHHYWVSATLTTLQRAYFDQYWRSSYRSYIPNAMSRYKTLRRVVTDPKTKKDVSLAVHDEDVLPLLDEAGNVQRDKNGDSVILLKAGIEHKQYRWERVTASDKHAYEWFRQHIYGGQSIPEIWRPAWLGGLLIFGLGTLALIGLDLFAQGRYMKGEAIRGTRELSPRAYAREHRLHTGYGITVYA